MHGTAPHSTDLEAPPSLRRIIVSRPGSAAPSPPRVAVRGSVANLPYRVGSSAIYHRVPSPCPGNEAALEAKLPGAGLFFSRGRVNSVALWSDVLRMAHLGLAARRCSLTKRGLWEVHNLGMCRTT